RLEAFNPQQRIADAEMAGMVRITQTIDDPEIEIFEVRPAGLGNIADIGRIGGVADPIAQRGNVAVREVESRERHGTALPLDRTALASFNGMAHQDRRILTAFGRDEAVGE